MKLFSPRDIASVLDVKVRLGNIVSCWKRQDMGFKK